MTVAGIREALFSVQGVAALVAICYPKRLS